MNMMSRIAAGTALVAPAPALATFEIVGSFHPDYDPEWSKLVEAYHAAVEERERLYGPYQDAEEQYFDAKPAMPPLPERKAVGKLWNANGTMNGDVLQELVREAHIAQGVDEEYNAQRAQWKARCDELYDEIVGPLERPYEVWRDRACELLSKITEYPVSSLAQLAEKVALLKSEYADDLGNGEELKHVAQDVQRLALAR